MKNIAVLKRRANEKIAIGLLVVVSVIRTGALFLIFNGDPNLTAASVKHFSLQIYYFP